MGFSLGFYIFSETALKGRQKSCYATPTKLPRHSDLSPEPFHKPRAPKQKSRTRTTTRRRTI